MLIVPGRPAATSLTWWAMWDAAVAPVFRIDGPGATSPPRVQSLRRPGDQLRGYDVLLITTTGLQPDSPYTLSAPFRGGGSFRANSRTLPVQLASDQPFTVALGSCYCLPRDTGLSACYPPELHAGESDPIRVRFLTGDQIYMDLTPTSGSPIIFSAPDPWERYFQQWLKPRFRDFLTRSPNVMMADDHEFWNDYPHKSAWLSWPSAEAGRTLDRLFSLFQSPLNVDPASVPPGAAGLGDLLEDSARTFRMDLDPLSLFVLDTRTRRTRYDDATPRIAKPPMPGGSDWLQQALNWLGGLQGPGVLVLSQPLVEKPATPFQRFSHTMGDVNLPDYASDYAALWDAVLAAPHDVLIAAGDIHWSRCYLLTAQGESQPRAYEIISSALARIPGAPHKVASEPQSGTVQWRCESRSAKWISVCPPTNATPSYATLSFRRFGAQIKAEVRWWTAHPWNASKAVPITSCELYLN
jgi:hypothetical protein